MKMRLHHNGFTLIELMIVVAIVGILAAIAYPSYREQIQKSRRADAQGVMFQLSQLMERIYSESGTYHPGGSLPGLGTDAADVFPDKAPLDGTDRHYTLVLADDGVATTDDYTIQATRQNAQANDPCGTLTLDNLGTKGITGADAGMTVDFCW